MIKNATIVLSLCALFLFYKYIVQLYPALISHDLMQTYGYDGVMLALMASSYYYSYTFLQIVAGIIIDRFAVKLPMFAAIFVISLMVLIFTHTQNFYLMCFSRFMMGVGASFATVLYMKCAASYAPSKWFGFISSLLMTATMLGAACGGAPLGMLFEHYGWQHGLNFVAVIGFVMAFAVLLAGKSQVKVEQVTGARTIRENLKEVLTRRNNWLLFFYVALTFSPVAILGGLWGAPFLMAKYNVTAANASTFLSVMFIALAIGSPLWALISAKLERRIELMHVANAISLLAIVAIIYGNFSYNVTLVLFFIFGLAVSCFMLGFELCRLFNAVAIMGLAVAFINSGEGVVISVVEPLIGYLLDLNKIGEHFTLENYKLALAVIPLCFILSSLVLSLVREKVSACVSMRLTAKAA